MHFKNNPLFQISLVLFVLGMTSCAGGATPSVELPTPEPLVENTPVPTAALLIEPDIQNNCLDCHTDKERLIDNAKPILEVISENEGAG
ncbi:MAG: hypothetical protein ISR59_07280 [Anaerolineales bacterium]|uniref:Cytochrome C Planctomycete-type domain-containing protein n=1 Tax=Candidatus Desulfolinea nitratireducens TaxID=2841698 RepID=A0A8J6NHL4_9CHLR|nr:hypothetical protein [Candidatus Desulfolinea nitratireducens]MBL6960896.1 hypothetical protein [Anaerolineales bacterium]